MDKNQYEFMLHNKTMTEFNEYCSRNAYNLSGKVELLIRKELMMAKRKANRYVKIYNYIKKTTDAQKKQIQAASGIKPAKATIVTEIPKQKDHKGNPKKWDTGHIPTIAELSERAFQKRRGK